VTLNWFKRGAPTTSDGIVKEKSGETRCSRYCLSRCLLGCHRGAHITTFHASLPVRSYHRPPPSHLATRIQERPSIPFRQFLRSSMPTQPRPASQIPFHPIKPLPLIRRQPKFVAAQACISRSCDQNGAWTTPRTREDEVVGFVQALKGGI